jgi:hypothetical protein
MARQTRKQRWRISMLQQHADTSRPIICWGSGAGGEGGMEGGREGGIEAECRVDDWVCPDSEQNWGLGLVFTLYRNILFNLELMMFNLDCIESPGTTSYWFGWGTERNCADAVFLLKTVAERGPWGHIMRDAYSLYKVSRSLYKDAYSLYHARCLLAL